MSLKYRVVVIVLATAIVTMSGCAAWAHLQSPERAETDRYKVWISLIKPFGTVVYYVGTKEPYDYFRIGSLFPTYYKAPACDFTLPRIFDLGSGKPYIVTQDNAGGDNSSPRCKRGQTDERKTLQGKPGGA